MNLGEARLKFIEINVDIICLFRKMNPMWGFGVSRLQGFTKSIMLREFFRERYND